MNITVCAVHTYTIGSSHYYPARPPAPKSLGVTFRGGEWSFELGMTILNNSLQVSTIGA